MTWAAISTWRMSFKGLKKASKLLQEQQSAGDAVEQLINDVESFPDYHSVGYGGYPMKRAWCRWMQVTWMVTLLLKDR